MHTLTPRMAVATLLCSALAATALAAPSPVIYPAKGQSSAQIDRDKYECFEWSKGQSGFDPMHAQAAPPAPAAPAQPTTAASTGAGSMTGMVKGAAGGAAVAELADKDVGKGAAVGVLGAAARERMKQQQAAQAQQQAAAQQQAQQQAQMAAQRQAREQQRWAFDRGFAACLEARGYVVK